ncbi:hypothetical protein PI124_g11698 [Phytophthora idaei]|nr:hypothetical protein PI125_g18834 [Phytophthora idaei]KAG3137344.1 hypothetical protein PI126_g17432 [Phytophthora idaei]KAG3243477.1 hypothetical protein PI124_g11698 [Phytophthora idaei]
MRLHVLHAVLVIATVLAQGIAPVTGLKTQVSVSDAALWSETLTTRRSIGKRLLRIEEAQHRGDNTTGSSNVTWASWTNSPPAAASDEEARGLKPLSSFTKLLKDKKIPTVITRLLNGNKHEKSQAKLRALLLRSLPPEQASNLIFLKMPKNVPKSLPSTLPKGIKGYHFKIPGISNAIIRLKMEIWFYYRLPPTYAFKQLGLARKGSGVKLHAEDNYKYFKSYFDAWYKAQKHLIF